jgi:Mn-dependent DtxR family transcriptional regulator
MDQPEEFWRQIYNSVLIEPQEGEKTIGMIAKELGVSYHTARYMVIRWVKEGRLISVGKRLVNGREMDAWATTTASHPPAKPGDELRQDRPGRSANKS